MLRWYSTGRKWIVDLQRNCIVGWQKIIDYSPHTKYTAQKIQDKVTRGAYFYSSFSIDDGIGSTTNIKKLIEKLTVRYNLNLTSRQRNLMWIYDFRPRL